MNENNLIIQNNAAFPLLVRVEVGILGSRGVPRWRSKRVRGWAGGGGGGVTIATGTVFAVPACRQDGRRRDAHGDGRVRGRR